MTDVTNKYVRMIKRFESDSAVAADAGDEFGLDELQARIEQKDEFLLADIKLLEELSLGIRCGFLKIMRDPEREAWEEN